MSKKYTVAFATGSRADYGIMKNFLKLLDQDSEIELKILTTGALLDDEYGHQVDLIYQDGFHVDIEVKTNIDTRSDVSIIHMMSEIQENFADYFAQTKLDLLMLLGDRYEMLSVAIAAAMQKIPILHVHGGEATFANYDEFIRHSITKMSLYHYTATDEYRKRVIQLGEQPERVFYLGALGAENCLEIDLKNVPDSVTNLQERQYFVVLFHPETLTAENPLVQIEQVLAAVEEHREYQYVFLGTNADTHSDIIRKRVKEFVESKKNAVYFENLHTDAYHYLLKHSIALVGNSSSGIIEAPSLGIYTINIGNRQDGRVRGNSVIDVPCKQKDILDALDKVLEVYATIKPVNPYYKEHTAENYYKKTKQLLENLQDDIKEPKRFYDL
jgi:UDP-hydrolysing UDP-N-acetyl-D-glucosamine 2-epimerase